MTNEKSRMWKYASLATLIILFLSIYPQLNIWLVKGAAWNGAYTVSNYDEVAYSAYVNSLIEGRPRKNDPFVGADNIPGETLYSIQAFPAYAVAVPARVLGISASMSFVILNFLIAIFSSLAIFALFWSVTGDEIFAAVGVLAVLCLGTAVAFQGELQHMILGNYLCDFFPFLRRYQPGLAFPLFFIFCLSVWKMSVAGTLRKEIWFGVASGLLLSVLIFSYFYLWTAAVAWMACFSLLRIVALRQAIIKTVWTSAIVGAFGLASIIPYFLLLSNRPQNMDDTQLLIFTRMPDPFELPEVIGLAIAAMIVILAKKKKLQFASPAVLLTLSLATTPIILFNQQVITGRSLQPVHYEIFIVNYLVLTAMMLLLWLVLKVYALESAKVRRTLLYIALVAVIWGF